AGAALVDHVAGDAVELGRRHARTDGIADAGVHLRDDAAGLSHLAQLVRRLAHGRGRQHHAHRNPGVARPLRWSIAATSRFVTSSAGPNPSTVTSSSTFEYQ